MSRTTACTFFISKIPLKAAYFEGKIHHKVEEVVENEALYRNFFDFFDPAVKISSKTWQF
jgi:hypothetical protein